MIDASLPFVLLDDAGDAAIGSSRLFTGAVEIVETREPAEVRACLGRVREAAERGLHAAGFLSYEAGYSLEAKLEPLGRRPPREAPPLLWFGLFEGCDEIEPAQVPSLLPDPASAWTAAPRPLIAQEDHAEAVARVKAHILAGDIYQANLTFPAEVRTAGSPLGVYAALRPRARAGHGGLVFTGAHWLLSFSPELFFTLERGRVTTRPMKGTAARHADAADDAAEAAALREDPKQRAENLMIVDLLRNDLSRVSRPGSVKVPSLFAVETYPTVHQMTSTVTSELESGVDPIRLVEAIFPCGSITGAPKIRAMELISEIEGHPRHAYTGAMGRVAPGGEASFNVAIRTIILKEGDDRGVMGLGSAIVADSHAGDEWRECLAKGAFAHDPARRFDLIETMRFDPREGVAELDLHMARMKASAEALGFPFSRHEARNELQAATFRLREPRKLRLLVSKSGAIAIESRRLPPDPEAPVGVAIVPRPVPRDDFRLSHKTSDRAFHDEARATAGTFEIVFEDEDGFLTEGSFTSLFVERDGRLVTPPLARGLLPGILRSRLIASGEAEEGDVRAVDLAGGFFIGNAVRGLLPAVVRRSSAATF
ncbi:aminodeoxychorismate synthase component I [Enterovirga sp. GCM10030262]|uniref:aminodeoxychorismate synthase component I n=1 Tax=Enterovirga sp. GCM10030262 TaxID=3273391 RepID=UPI0036155040